MKIYSGTSGFAYKEWKGSFYPEKLPAKDMLRSYAERLGTVEVNNTFYHMPTAGVLTSWAEQVPEGFLFSIKAPQVITHFKQLRNVRSETRYLFGTLPVLERKQGPVLFQFPKSFRPDPSVLRDFLSQIPAGTACAFEFRGPDVTSEVLDLLHGKGCSLCIADSDEAPAEEIVSTAGWGYLRLRRSGYTDADLSRWADKVLAQKWERAFIFFKHEGEGANGPEDAMRFQRMVEQRGRVATGGAKAA